MKKLFLPILVLATIATVGCKKDEEESPNNPPTPEDEFTIFDETLAEGVFQPMLHLDNIKQEGNTVMEFSWDGNILTTAKTEEGNCTFSYNGNKLASVANNKETIQYSYTNNQLNAARILSYGTMLSVRKNFTHTGDKITHIDFDSISPLYLMTLIQEYVGPLGAKDSKFSLGPSIIETSLEWNGDNVSSEQMEASLIVNIAPSEIARLLDLSSLIRSAIETSYPNIAPILTDDIINSIVSFIASQTDEIPVEIMASLTNSYTYDNARNPLQYYWGEAIDAHSLSANNMLTQTTTTQISALAHYTVPADFPLLGTFLGGQNIDLPYNMEPTTTTMSVSYQYNSKNFPTRMTCEGMTATFKYK